MKRSLTALFMLGLTGCGSFDVGVSTNPTPTQSNFVKNWCAEPSKVPPGATLVVNAIKEYANLFIRERDPKKLDEVTFCELTEKKITELGRVEIRGAGKRGELDLRPLADLPGLYSVSLVDNDLKDHLLEPISGISALEDLDLSQNPALTKLPKLPAHLLTIKFSETAVTVEDPALSRDLHPSLVIVPGGIE